MRRRLMRLGRKIAEEMIRMTGIEDVPYVYPPFSVTDVQQVEDICGRAATTQDWNDVVFGYHQMIKEIRRFGPIDVCNESPKDARDLDEREQELITQELVELNDVP